MFRIIIFLSALSLASTGRILFYRKDYTFIEEFDAFYKLHWDLDGTSWTRAFMACDDEGAQLFYPKEKGEWAVVKNLTGSLVDTPNTTDIIIGIHDEIGQGEFVTVDGISAPTPLNEGQITDSENCVLMDIETGTYKVKACSTELENKRLYVCKKIDDRPCPTIDQGYKYAKLSKKCYKINMRWKTWHEAYHTCYMEGGLLLTPENDEEAKLIVDTIPSDLYFPFFAGFRRIYPGSDFYTIKGRKLQDGGYEQWYDLQNENQQDCGVVYKRSSLLYTKSMDCKTLLPFICEMQRQV